MLVELSRAYVCSCEPRVISRVELCSVSAAMRTGLNFITSLQTYLRHYEFSSEYALPADFAATVAPATDCKNCCNCEYAKSAGHLENNNSSPFV